MDWCDFGVMILAAGRGERLRPLTDLLPKPLFPILGEPVVVGTIRQLAALGVGEIVVNLWHLGGKIRATLGDRCEGVTLRYVDETTLLGTGGGIRNARRYWGRRPVLVVNGKLDIDLGNLAWAGRHAGGGAQATLLVRRVPDDDPYPAIEIVADGGGFKVAQILGTPSHGGVRTMFTGVHVIEPAVLDRLPDGPSCIVRQGYLPTLADGGRVAAVLHDGWWAAVETAKNYLDANLARWDQTPRPCPRGTSRTVIGKNVVVESGARVADSVIWDGSRVPAGASIRRAIVTANGTFAV